MHAEEGGEGASEHRWGWEYFSYTQYMIFCSAYLGQ